MTTSRRVGLATSAGFYQYDEDAAALVAALAARGVVAAPVIWDDPTVDWAGLDLVVIRSTWDYIDRHQEFVAWAQRVPRLLNTAAVVGWNTHKCYLAELAAAGVPVVPTRFLVPGAPVELPTDGEYVIKPAVSAGAKDTARYTSDDGEAARSQVTDLQRAGHTVMVQPYLSGIDAIGETALIYLGGAYSHSIRKAPLLAPAGAEPIDPHGKETISHRVADPAQLAVAQSVLQAVPGGPDDLLYARVDLIPGPRGPLLLELELTEPSLFLGYAPGAADRFAAVVATAADAASPTVRA